MPRIPSDPHPSLRLPVLLLLLLAGGVLVTGCATRLSVEPVEIPGDVVIDDWSATGEDGEFTVTGTVVTCPGQVVVSGYDGETDTIVVGYALDVTPPVHRRTPDTTVDASEAVYVACSPAERRIAWAAESNATRMLAGHGGVIFSRGAKRQIHDGRNGEFVRPAEPSLFLMNEQVLELSDDRYAKLDLLTGDVAWEREGSNWLGYRREYDEDGWLYVVADGLHCMSLETGEGWDADVSTDHKGHAEALAKNLALGCLAGLAGSYNTTTVEAKVYHNATSDPLVVDDHVYFAARDNLYCFARADGELVWESPLTREFGTMILQRNGDSIVVTSAGWKYVDFAIKEDETPEIMRYDMHTGELLGSMEFAEPTVVLSIHWSEPYLFALTADEIIKLDEDLAIIGARSASVGRRHLRFMDKVDGALVVRTTSGVLAIDPESLETLWSAEVGPACLTPASRKLTGHWEEGARICFDAGLELSHCRYQDGLYWLTTADGQLKAVDLQREGEIVLTADLGTDLVLFDRRAILANRQGSVLVIPYDHLPWLPGATSDVALERLP